MNNSRLKLKGILMVIMLMGVLLSTIFIAFYSNAYATDKNAKTKQPPKISIQSEYSLENVPNAVPNKSYKIFNATASDMFGAELNVEVKVYIYYSSQTRSRIYVENNQFIPQYEGVYTVEYTTEDKTGNCTVLTYEVNCVSKAPLTAIIKNETTTAFAGNRVKLADIELNNVYGNENYTVEIECNGKQFTHSNGYFTPTIEGEYTVTYTYFDYNETDTYSYNITVLANPNPIIIDDINLQTYYIVGASYNLPLPTAYSYELGYPVKIIPTVTVVYENGLKYEIADTTNFILENAGKFSILYKATFEDKETELLKENLVSVDVGYDSAKGNGKIDVTKYFNTNDYVKKEALRSGVSFTTATDNSEIEFINKLLSVEFDIGFGFSKTNNHFDRLDITLTDSINKDEQIVISLLKKSNTVSDLAINGVVVSKVTVPFYSEDEQNLHYDNFTRKINIGNSEGLSISKTVNGEYFGGFSSEFITLSFQIAQVKGDSTVFIYKINNQTMSRSGDTTVPHLYYDLYSGGKKTVGDTVTITRLYLSDVLAPSFSVDYSVKGPDGNYVTDINGVILSPENMDYTKDYVFEIPAYGRYFVSIKIADAFGNDDEFAYGINISDSSAPEISLEDNNTQTVKVGSSITIRKATAVDNINGKVDIYAYLVSPTLYTQEYKIGDTVVLNHKGIYHVYYYAYDEAGNVSFAEYTIVAE